MEKILQAPYDSERSPDLFPDVMVAAGQRQDLNLLAARHRTVFARDG